MHISKSAIHLLQEARRKIKVNASLTPRQRNDWRASINAIVTRAERSGLVSTDQSASPLMPEAEVDRLLTTMRDGANRSDKDNISRTRAALSHEGYDIANGWGRKALVGEWASAQATVAAENWQKLMTFPEWAQAGGIAPPRVTGRTLLDYIEHRGATLAREQKGERQRFLALVDTWPVICDALKIPVPDDLPERAHKAFRYRFDEMAWDPSLRAEFDRATHVLMCRAAPWRLPKANQVKPLRDAISRFASAGCRSNGIPPRSLTSLAPLLTVDAVTEIASFLTARFCQYSLADWNAATYAALCLACLLADHCYDVDDATRAQLLTLREDHARPLSIEMPGHRQARLQQFEDPAAITRLYRASHQVLDEFFCARQIAPTLLDRGCAAMGLHLGLAFGLYPHMLSECVVRTKSVRSCHSAAEIIEGEQVIIYVARSSRSAGRAFELTDETLERFRRFRARTVDLPGCSPEVLLPTLDGGSRSPIAVGRSITSLMATAKLVHRVTAGDMPAISAIAVLVHSLGTRELARRHLGRNLQAEDPLLDAIDRWRRCELRDSAILGEG